MCRDIVMSVKFELTPARRGMASLVLQSLKKHKYFRDSIVYFPNAFNKGFCKMKESDIDWDLVTVFIGHCFGVCGLKCYKGYLCDGMNGTAHGLKCHELPAPVKTTDHSCWAFTFRSQMRKL